MSAAAPRALALLTVTVLVLAGRQFWLAWEQRRLHARRSALTQVEAQAATLRYRSDAWLRRSRLGAYVEQELATAGIDVSVLFGTAVTGLLLLGAFTAIASIAPWWAAALATWGAWRGLRAYVESRRGQRLEAFVAQLPELTRTISNAVAAGQSLDSAVRLAGREMTAPAGPELRRVAESIRIGASTEQALQQLRERMPSREVGVLTTTLLIQGAAGGDLVRALREMADTLEKRKDLRGEIRTLLAGAVFTGYAVVGLGVVALLMVNSLQPGALDALLSSWVGRGAVIVGGGLYAVGLLLIRRAQAVEV